MGFLGFHVGESACLVSTGDFTAGPTIMGGSVWSFRLPRPMPCETRKYRWARIPTFTSPQNLRISSEAPARSLRNLADLQNRNQLDRHRFSRPSTKTKHLRGTPTFGSSGSEDIGGTYLARIRPNSFRCSRESSERHCSPSWIISVRSRIKESRLRVSLSEERAPSVVQRRSLCARR